MNTLRTPLSKVKGLGSAKDGTDHFWVQRLTAIALAPLCLWFCFSLASLPSMDYLEFSQWLSSPFRAVMMILVILVAFYHAALGLQVVIEDYVGNTAIRTGGIIAVKMLCAFLAVTGVFSILKIALTTTTGS